jgi:hypothetical protein
MGKIGCIPRQVAGGSPENAPQQFWCAVKAVVVEVVGSVEIGLPDIQIMGRGYA